MLPYINFKFKILAFFLIVFHFVGFSCFAQNDSVLTIEKTTKNKKTSPLSVSPPCPSSYAVFFPLATSFLSSTRRLPRENRFILPCQSSIIEDNDVGNGKIKHSLTDMVSPPTTALKKWLYPALAATTYTAGMTFLYQSWYKNENQTSFHFFNDNQQWNQLDKFGHAYTSYQLGKISYYSLKSLKYSEKTALWFSTAGFWLMLPIEIFDGFSPTYGASYGDLIANGTGSLLFLTQQIAFKEQRIQFKFSFFPTSYSDLRPNVLGENLPTKIIKDYNGQIYWFSSSPVLWLKSQKSTLDNQANFPKWLALSLGYGANTMLYGNENQNNANGYSSSRTFYLSLDINFSQIKTKRKGLKLLFGVFDGIKVPFPALYYDTKKGFNGSLLAF